MSLTLNWWEHDDGIRVDDSLGDEVKAFFGQDVEVLRNHQTFGESFQVKCVIITDFEHNNREIGGWTGSSFELPLKRVLDVLTSRRQLIRSVARKLDQALAEAARGVLERTRLKSLSTDYIDGLPNDFDEPMMIHYLNFVLARSEGYERLDPEFYGRQSDAFVTYFFSHQDA